ncbi:MULTISPECIES: diaminopropionate ammonia-lyase [Klebsiella]|uniref:diaminopropionate ammonia-lyase n=1 Tax=Klebsiella TaxID=570 RepID=UPI000F040C64|nr:MULTISPECIES: diaminopropionate ammonia-lyase [Klebsiella]HCI5690550.1 diaminopropionate ammonia-lyase [Klebsiella variicola subsp. variicola]HCI6100858.1 diaminopropionate ammonia-lyase [Klebsiella variicola subsp. variicola]HCI6538262.1 diaminopropionate ammonia-lyase [Klebsiella variicola subsp. variicola]
MQLHINASDWLVNSGDAAEYDPFRPERVAEINDRLRGFEYHETPLYRLPELARSLGIAELYIKDEGQRSSLKSFKTLGGAHAVIRQVLTVAEQALGRAVMPAEVDSAEVRDVAGRMTITCATDGNHGRAVAAAAARLGCRAVIYIHKGVSERRAAAIREQGAEVVRVDGSYDDSVAFTIRTAAENGWHVVSDTSWPGYETIPTWVMQGYLPMADELARQIAAEGQRPSHIFLQAGVGGFAAAVAAHLRARLGEHAPQVIVVEPDKAACVFFSSISNRSVRVAEEAPTIMGMLECYEPSLIAWNILERSAAAFLTVADNDGLRAMARLATPFGDDPAVRGGESGAAGLAGLQVCIASARARELLKLDRHAVVLLINTEGATDETLYAGLLDQGRALL